MTGYGLAASQLARLKEQGIHVTACVDQISASGGYMMACAANEITAAPFAAIGSIGVVASIPNFAERLEREGVKWEDVTAGKYKRTMTPYKKTTEEERKKVMEDVALIHKLFKEYISKNRPSLDVDSVATGEVWSGIEALKLGLVDKVKTSEDVLLSYREQGYKLYRVKLCTKRSYKGIWNPYLGGVSAWFREALEAAFKDVIEGASTQSLLPIKAEEATPYQPPYLLTPSHPLSSMPSSAAVQPPSHFSTTYSTTHK